MVAKPFGVVLLLLLLLGACSLPGREAAIYDMDHQGSGYSDSVIHGELHLAMVWGQAGLAEDNAAVYSVIRNNGNTAERLVAVYSEVAGAAELHEVKMADNAMQMQQVSGGIEIPAGGEVVLQPGGYHVMLIGLNQDLEVGGSHLLRLQFENAGGVGINVVVQQR